MQPCVADCTLSFKSRLAREAMWGLVKCIDRVSFLKRIQQRLELEVWFRQILSCDEWKLWSYSLSSARQAQHASRRQNTSTCSFLPAASQLGTSDDVVHNLPRIFFRPLRMIGSAGSHFEIFQVRCKAKHRDQCDHASHLHCTPIPGLLGSDLISYH